MNFKIKSALFVLATVVLGISVASATQIEVKSIPTRTPLAGILLPPPSIQPSQTLIPTASPTGKVAPTWTPLPTLSIKQAQEKINALNLNNGGCQLPCWWGITPNITTWQETLQFLASFTVIKQGENGSFFEGGKTYHTMYFEVYYDIPGEEESRRMLFSGQDGVVIGITVFPPDTEPNYKLDQLLMLFGKPNQIYVSAQPYSQTVELPPAIIILDYTNFGILASYQFPLHKSGENLNICPKSVGARLELQDPQIKYTNALSIEEYVSMITGFDPKKLENVSEMNIDAFYEAFQDPSSSVCLETPVILWP